MLTAKIENNAWRIDDDGFLRVTARILQEGTYPYAASELPADVQAEFPTIAEIFQRIPADEFTDEALTSLEGKPVIVDGHEWQTADGQAKAKDLKVGTVAGKPVKDGDSLLCDFLIDDPDAIKAIQARHLQEVSAGYESNLEPATDENADFDATQRNLRFNHILLLPAGAGRCGHDVRILNSKTTGATMPITRTLNGKTFNFGTEDDAKAADGMASAAKEGMEPELKSRDEKIQELNAAVETHIVKLTETAGLLKQAQDDLAAFTSEESQETAYNERAGFEKDEAAVVDAEPEGDEKKQLAAALGNAKGIKARKALIVQHVMNSRKIDTAAYTEPEINATWKVLVGNAAKKPEAKAARLPMPAPIHVNNAAQADSQGRKHPIFR